MVADGKRLAGKVGLVEIESEFEIDYESVSWFTSRCSRCGWTGDMRTDEDIPSFDDRFVAMRDEAKEHMRSEHPDLSIEA